MVAFIMARFAWNNFCEVDSCLSKKRFGILKLCICLVAVHGGAVANIVMCVPNFVGNMIHTRPPVFHFVFENRIDALRESTKTKIED